MPQPIAYADTLTASGLCAILRPLRRAARLSLRQFQERYAISAVVLGAYERGDRVPPVDKLETILGHYGYRLVAVPADSAPAGADLAIQLRVIADRIDGCDTPSAVSADAGPADG